MQGGVTYDGVYLGGSISVHGTEPVIEEKTITENGTYNTPSGVDGFNPVIVNVPSEEPVIEEKTITENGTYNAPSGVDGFNPVIVNVPQTTLTTLNVTENGTYNAPSNSGYSQVNVNVSKGVSFKNVNTPYYNTDSSSSNTVFVDVFDENATVNNFLKNLRSVDFTGSSSYTCSTTFTNYNSGNGQLTYEWGSQSGTSRQGFDILYVEDTTKIVTVVDWATYTGTSIEINLPEVYRSRSVDDFIIDFRNIVTGSIYGGGYISKTISNNKLVISIPSVSSGIPRMDLRILVVD